MRKWQCAMNIPSVRDTTGSERPSRSIYGSVIAPAPGVVAARKAALMSAILAQNARGQITARNKRAKSF